MSFALLKSLGESEFAIAAFIAISVFSIGVSRMSVGASPWARRAVPIVFLLSTLALLLFSRREILRYDVAINPDEALMAAHAMLARYGWLDWNIVDPSTSGPLNSMVLAWPYLFGGEITFFSTRLTGIGCIFGVACALFLALRRLSDDGTAIVAVAPVVVFLAGSTYFDVIHYSSEQFSLLLMSIAVYLFVRSFRAGHLGLLIGAAFVLGMVPFAKLQAGPIAAVIGCFVLARAVTTGMQRGAKTVARNVAAVAAAALLPAMIFLVPLYLLGGFDDFLKSYIIQQELRITEWSNPLPRFIVSMPVFHSMPEAYVMAFVIGIVVAGFAVAVIGIRLNAPPAIAWNLALGAVMLPVALASIALSGRVFFHYLFLAVPALIILGGVTLAGAIWLIGSAHRKAALLLRGLYLCGALAIAVVNAHDKRHPSFARAGGAFLQGRPFSATHTLEWLRPSKADRMVCWGWQSECYVNAAIAPATREASNESQLYDTSLRPYFRSRFLADFARSHPDFVIDTVAPGSFGFQDPRRQGIASFPELSAIIARDFVRLSDVSPPDRCPRLYVRKARLAALEKSMIEFASVSAIDAVAGHPAQALDDRSIFETCDDYWLLPKGELGSATIDFAAAGPLAAVAILNTRNGDSGDQASDRVRLSARLGGKTVAQTELSLERFPRWTYYRFDKPVMADALAVEILSYRGVGAGLNEVKAYRD